MASRQVVTDPVRACHQRQFASQFAVVRCTGAMSPTRPATPERRASSGVTSSCWVRQLTIVRETEFTMRLAVPP